MRYIPSAVYVARAKVNGKVIRARLGSDRLVGLRVIEETEQAYKGFCSHLSKWRRSEEIPWSAFADSTRWHIRQETFNEIQDALKNTVENYRRKLWSMQPF